MGFLLKDMYRHMRNWLSSKHAFERCQEIIAEAFNILGRNGTHCVLCPSSLQVRVWFKVFSGCFSDCGACRRPGWGGPTLGDSTWGVRALVNRLRELLPVLWSTCAQIPNFVCFLYLERIQCSSLLWQKEVGRLYWGAPGRRAQLGLRTSIKLSSTGDDERLKMPV